MAVIPGQAVTAYPLPDEELSPTSKNAVSNEAVCEGLDEIKNTLNSEIATRQTYVRPNLLDNWYFGNPVNQRGLSIYSNGGYTVDRWKAYEGTTITTESDGLLVESNQNSSWKLGQQYERGFLEGIKGKEVTFSVLFKGQTTGYIAVNIYTNEGNHTGNSETSESGIAKATYTIPNNITDFRCIISGGAAFHAKIVAMKLELGSGQTLAHQENGQWVLNEIPDYGEQMLKCQRYFQTFRTQSLRPTYGEDCRPVMTTASPATGTITKGNVTYYTLSSEP